MTPPYPDAGALRPPQPDQLVDLPFDRKPSLIVVIDTEEDFDWNSPYSSSSMAVHGMRQVETLQRIFDEVGIKPIYMVDYPVASQRNGYAPLLEIIADGRCEIGAHLHPWVSPPIIEEICVRNTFPCNLPPALESEKLRVLTATIAANLGVWPEVYKAGRYGIGAATPTILIDQGYKIDLSVVPTRDYCAEAGPDFGAFHVDPFWVDPGRRLLEIPLTCGFTGALRLAGRSVFRMANSNSGRTVHLAGALARLGILNRVTLTPEGVSLREAKALTRSLMSSGIRVFTLAFHSTSLTPGSTPYVKSAAERDAAYRWLEGYFDFFLGEVGGQGITPLQFYDTCTEAFRHHAPKRPPYGLATAAARI